jgi:hypothetical protein
MTAFYINLYTKDRTVENNYHTRRQCIASIPRIVTVEQNARLLQPISHLEMQNALLDLPKGKALGEDRLPSEFYQVFPEATLVPLTHLAMEIKAT